MYNEKSEEKIIMKWSFQAIVICTVIENHLPLMQNISISPQTI